MVTFYFCLISGIKCNMVLDSDYLTRLEIIFTRTSSSCEYNILTGGSRMAKKKGLFKKGLQVTALTALGVTVVAVAPPTQEVVNQKETAGLTKAFNVLGADTASAKAKPKDKEKKEKAANKAPQMKSLKSDTKLVRSVGAPNNKMELSLRVQDKNKGDKLTVMYSINGVEEKVTEVTATGSYQTVTKSITVPNDLEDGSHTVKVWVEDKFEEKTSKSSIKFKVDNKKPSIGTKGFTNGKTYTTDVRPIIKVTDKSKTDLVITDNGTVMEDGTSIKGSGLHTLVVTATDSLGNKASKTYTLTINRTPVIGSIPTQNTNVGKTITIDLAKYTKDKEKDNLTFNVTAQNENNVSFTQSNYHWGKERTCYFLCHII